MIYLNDAGSKMLGINTSDVQNHLIFEVIPDDLLEKVNNIVLPSIMKNGSWEGEIRYKNIQVITNGKKEEGNCSSN